MRLNTALSEVVQADSEYLFLPSEAGLQIPTSAMEFDKTCMVELAAETLSLMGLDAVLRPGGESPVDIVPKPHSQVVDRDAAVAEQFHHPDVAQNGFCGIFLIGLEGDDPDKVPTTNTVDNKAMVEHIDSFVAGGALEGRLNDIVVVRPFFDAENRTEWMDLPRHSLDRLGARFELLLSPSQLEHVSRERAKIVDRSRYEGDVSIAKLASESIVDGNPLLTCGVAQRELRLAMGSGQTEEETSALEALHDEITRYLMDPLSPEKRVKVVRGSAIFVPVNQLHRATPYERHYKRSVVGVRCYAQPGNTPPPSWERASGLDY